MRNILVLDRETLVDIIGEVAQTRAENYAYLRLEVAGYAAQIISSL